MKKFLGILVLGLLWCNVGFANEKKYSLFGVYIGDDINKYQPNMEIEIKPNAFLINPPKPNKDFIKYYAGINRKNNKISYVGGIHKKNFVLGNDHKNMEKLEKQWLKCSNELKEYARIVAEGKQFNHYFLNLGDGFDDPEALTRIIWLNNLKEFPFDTQFSVSLDCGKYGAIETKDDVIGLRGELSLMDHRNLEQKIKDNKEFKKKQLRQKIDKSGLE